MTGSPGPAHAGPGLLFRPQPPLAPQPQAASPLDVEFPAAPTAEKPKRKSPLLKWGLVALIVSLIAFGLWMARRIRTSGGYFLGDRRLPWWVMVGQAFGTYTGTVTVVGHAPALASPNECMGEHHVTP